MVKPFYRLPPRIFLHHRTCLAILLQDGILMDGPVVDATACANCNLFPVGFPKTQSTYPLGFHLSRTRPALTFPPDNSWSPW